MSGGASPTLAINAVTNKVGRQCRQHNIWQWQVALANPTSESRRTAGASGGLCGRTNVRNLKVNEKVSKIIFTGDLHLRNA